MGVSIPIDHQGYADVYIDDITGLTIDLPGTRNADQIEAAISLAIKAAAQSNNKNELITREPMITNKSWQQTKVC